MTDERIYLATEGGVMRPARPTSAWRSHAVSAAALHGMKFPDINYVVPEFIPEGLSILGGRPKVGKSWLALDICLGISIGQEVLGVTPERGDVLYCALEDNDRRLQRRMKKLLWPPRGAWPRQLMLATRWRKLDGGGVDDIADWASSASKPKLVVLDTLAGVRPERNRNDTTYDGDYKALVEAHHLANDKGFGILILTHTRKAESEDQLDAISGTLGQVGCADTGMVLSKGPKGATLYVRGRDVEEVEKAVVFNADTCRWQVLGDAIEVQRSDTRKKIIAVLEDADDVVNPGEIARATGIPRNSVDQMLHKMLKDGEAVTLGRGKYALPSKAHKLKE